MNLQWELVWTFVDLNTVLWRTIKKNTDFADTLENIFAITHFPKLKPLFRRGRNKLISFGVCVTVHH